MRPSTLEQREITPKRFSRRFVLVGAGCALAASKLLAANAFAGEPSALPYSPDEVDMEIAALGEWLLNADPELAATIESAGRESLGLLSTADIDWTVAQQARMTLTAPERISAELASEDIVFVDDWLLAASEVAVALLFAAANSGAEK